MAPSGISSFSAISATSVRSSSLRFASKFVRDMVLSLLVQLCSVKLTRGASRRRRGNPNRLQAREAVVRDPNPQLALERTDDLEHAERVDDELVDAHGYDHIVEMPPRLRSPSRGTWRARLRVSGADSPFRACRARPLNRLPFGVCPEIERVPIYALAFGRSNVPSPGCPSIFLFQILEFVPVSLCCRSFSKHAAVLARQSFWPSLGC